MSKKPGPSESKPGKPGVSGDLDPEVVPNPHPNHGTDPDKEGPKPTPPPSKPPIKAK